MEALVNKVLKKQLKLFIKNFNPDQLSVSAMKGEGQMTDLALSEKVIQELLYIPMNLEVTKASCDLLNIKVPWTSLNSKPVVLTLNKVDIDLREPVEISHMPSALKKSKPKTKSDLTDNMQVVVNNVHMTVQTLGGPLVMIDLDDILIQSTNNKWEVVDLAQARDFDKDQGIESLYKKLTVRAINLALITEKSSHMVLNQMPLKILFSSKRRGKDWTLLRADLEFILEKINFRWTQQEFLLMVELIKGFQTAFARPVPPTPVPAIPKSSSNSALSTLSTNPDVSYKLRIDNWAVDFIEAFTPDEKGYSFFGDGLSIVFNSAKTTSVQKTEVTSSPILSSTPAPAIEVEETLISVLINTIKFRELLPRAHTPPLFVTPKDDEAKGEGKQLLKASLTLRRPTSPEAAAAQAVPIIGVEMLIALSNLMLVADRTVWKNLIRFLSIVNETSEIKPKPAIEASPSDAAPAADQSQMEDAKHKLNQLKDKLGLTENWQNQIKISVKASDLRVIIPSELSGEYEGLSLQLDLGSFGVNNNADWKTTPNLPKGLAILAAPLPAPPIVVPRTVGPPHKLSFHLEGVGMAVLGKDKVTHILEPAGVSLFVHYFERESRVKTEQPKPQLEVVFYSGEFNLHANEKQFSYLQWVGRKYLDPRKLKNTMSARVKKAKEVAAEKIKDFQAATPQTEYVKPIKEKVSSALEAYKWTVYIHIDKGVFKVPLHFFIAPPAGHEVAPAFSDPLAVQANTAVEEVISGEVDNPCELKFEHLDLALENNINGQGVVLQLGSFQATGLDHPKLPSIITLVPLVGRDDEKLPPGVSEVESLLFRYKRKRKATRSGETPVEPEEFITEVLGRLQRMQVRIARKPNHPGFNTGGMGLPDVQGMVNKAVSLIQERRGDINALQANVKQINFDVKWSVELGNCEVSMEKAEDPSSGTIVYKPYGTVRLVDAARPNLVGTCKDFESRLVNAKFSLAQNEVEKEEKNTIIHELQAALMKSQQEKENELSTLREQYAALEMKLVQAKMAMAQMQEEADNQASRYGKKK
jgi:hypothetical protein